MGRKKIQISRITDERNRQVTFNKRKFGVMKKAYELSVLCDCEIALIIFSSSNKLYQYASTDMDKVLLKYTEYNEPHESLTNKNIIEKENKNGAMSPESPEHETDYTLTPRTEAKYNKIDEDFQLMMQRNHRVNMSGTNYTMPVSVPVAGNYSEPGMLQASPQIAHTNISPRPSSSETDSVYPSGSMLEMSNGYPPSASPLGGSPSPGPSPGISGHQNNKSSHISHASHKQHSPVCVQNARNTSLRVVIPTPLQSNLSTEDMSYSEQIPSRQSQSALNTPVVTLQTPIPGLANYSLSSFAPQDFSINSSEVMGLPSWTTHQSLSTVQHTRYNGLSHLTLSNSTPPPSTSPVSVKVKSEPVSPPRDHQSGHQTHSSSLLSQASSVNLSCTQMNNAAVISVSNQASPVSLGVLNHPQHLVMSSRPSSAGHLTPTSGTVTPTNAPSPVNELRHSSSSHHADYDSSNQPHKRPRISEGWST